MDVTTLRFFLLYVIFMYFKVTSTLILPPKKIYVKISQKLHRWDLFINLIMIPISYILYKIPKILCKIPKIPNNILKFPKIPYKIPKIQNFYSILNVLNDSKDSPRFSTKFPRLSKNNSFPNIPKIL